MIRLFVTVLVFVGLLAGLGHAGEDAKSALYPKIPKAVGAPHPEGNAFMRANHALLLLEDRDKTMRQGDRDIKFSLKGCVACHAVYGPDSKPVGYESPQYFCRVCHTFASVKIDCFTCHKATPDPEILQRLLSEDAGNSDTTKLMEYLNTIDPPPPDQALQGARQAQNAAPADEVAQ
jgi:[DsrC]-trisulfide reductase subunit J